MIRHQRSSRPLTGHSSYHQAAEQLWLAGTFRPVGVVMHVVPVDPGRQLVAFRCGICRRTHVACLRLGRPPFGLCHDPAYFFPVRIDHATHRTPIGAAA